MNFLKTVSSISFVFLHFLSLIFFCSCHPQQSKPVTASTIPTESVSVHDSTSKSNDSSCTISLFSGTMQNEYNCSIFDFKYNNQIVLTDTNTELTGIYYPQKSQTEFVNAFDYYDSPTGRRKLLLFNLKKRKALRSDWFDNAAIGDSIDLQSFDFDKLSFKVWSARNDLKVAYKVKLHPVGSW